MPKWFLVLDWDGGRKVCLIRGKGLSGVCLIGGESLSGVCLIRGKSLSLVSLRGQKFISGGKGFSLSGRPPHKTPVSDWGKVVCLSLTPPPHTCAPADRKTLEIYLGQTPASQPAIFRRSRTILAELISFGHPFPLIMPFKHLTPAGRYRCLGVN